MVNEPLRILSPLYGVAEFLEEYADRILATIVVAVVTALLVAVVRQSMRRGLKPRLPLHIYRVVENLTIYSIVFIAALVILGLYGINLTGLLVAGGFAGLVVGLASQQAVSNLVSGLFLVFEQPLRPGDPVSIDGIGGVVVDVGLLSTRIRTWDGYIVRMPNSKVFNTDITNFQRTKARRVEFEIGISYGSSIEKAVEAIMAMMDDHPFCLVNPGPQVFVDRYADSAVVLKVRCWAPPQVWFSTKIELQTRVKKVLEDAGVEIPFPQLDLHLKDPDILRVRVEDGKVTGECTGGSNR